MKIEEYEHHKMQVSVVEEFKGRHKEICICHQGCKKFKPNTFLVDDPVGNCGIAERAFGLSKQFGLVLVMECKHFEGDENV